MSEQNYSLAFVFPGQGSQSVGMVSSLAEAYPIVKQTFEHASEILNADLWDIVSNDPAGQLNQTQITQPIMLSAGVALWRVWCEQTDKRPGWLAGHSLGEYTALVCANAISFEDAIRLVFERGRLMQEAVPVGVGAMAAILGLQDHEVVAACSLAAQNQVVTAANFNAPGQVVIAGNTAAVERAMDEAKKLGAKRAVKLSVSVPSHCALMESASENLYELLQNIAIETPDTTIIHNSDVQSHSSPSVIRHALKDQLFKSVRWVESVKFMHEQGVSGFVECGPGKVLMGLNKRIAADAMHLTMFDPASVTNVLEYVNG